MWLRTRRLFDGTADLGPATIVLTDSLVSAVLPWEAPVPAGTELADVGEQVISPGLVDVHCHGGGGAEFGTDPARALAVHRAAGSTTVVASLVTRPLDELERQVRLLAPLVDAGELAGIHLEGPWLSAAYRGAHPFEQLRIPQTDDLNRMLAAAAGTVRMVTIAPELPGGLAAVRMLAQRGVVVAVGHTDADLSTTRAALAAGASGATHLFNAMRPFHHRDPGPILGLVTDRRAWLELVVDGSHIDLDLVTETIRCCGDRVVLVTDAIAAAGMPDGDYRLGSLAVRVAGGVARVLDGGVLGGSTLTLAQAVRNTVGAGIDWRQVLRCATTSPARYLGLTAGRIAPGRPADLVAWDADWRVSAVWRRGHRVAGFPGDPHAVPGAPI